MLGSFLRRIDIRLVWAFPIAAGIVHLIVTLIATNETSKTAYARLTPNLPLNTMTMLPPVTPEAQPLPYMSSDSHVSLCPFDTADGTIQVRAELPDIGWTIGVYTPDGDSAYFAAAAPGRKATMIALTIIPADDRFQGLTPQAIGKAPVTSPELVVAVKKGLIVVRAPDSGAPYRAMAEATLARATCSRRAG